MSSSTCSRGSPPSTSMRRRAGPADISSVNCDATIIGFMLLRDGRGGVRRPRRLGRGLEVGIEFRCGEREVAMDGRDRGRRIAQPERVDDGLVELGEAFPVDTRSSERQIRPADGLEVAPDPCQRAVRGELDQAGMERHVGLCLVADVAGRCRSLDLLDQRLELLEVVIRELADGQPGAERFELCAHRERFEELRLAGAAHPGAAEMAAFDETEGTEIAKGLPNGRLADAKLARHPGLDDAGPGWVAAVKDRLEQAILDLVAQEAARDRGRPVHVWTLDREEVVLRLDRRLEDLDDARGPVDPDPVARLDVLGGNG